VAYPPIKCATQATETISLTKISNSRIGISYRKPLATTMASKQPFKTTFDVGHVIRPIFTGGSVALDNGARLLATVLGEDVVLTDPATGKHLGQIEGVRLPLQALSYNTTNI
jgi:hypothetical protein